MSRSFCDAPVLLGATNDLGRELANSLVESLLQASSLMSLVITARNLSSKRDPTAAPGTDGGSIGTPP